MRAKPLVLVLLVATAGCTARRTVGQPTLSVVNDSINLTPRNKVDLLFMIDDSLSMITKQTELRNRLPGLFQQISDLATMGAPASFHIGVVDSDMGAGLNTANCKAGGDGGRLRTAASDASTTPPPANCAGFALSADAPYIDYDSGSGTSNTGTLGVSDALSCLASVGDMGCGFEAPLEAVYQALTSPSLNPGFLRDDALLVVVLLTDEDDCSAPPDTALFENTPAAMATYGVLHSFRCTQFGITCDGKALDGSAVSTTSCTPVVGGPLYDVSRYQALFAAGGLKQSASDVLLVSIAAPPTPFSVDVSSPCADQVSVGSCPILEHSCTGSSNPMFFGDPAVRLHTVMSSTVNSVEASICDPDYSNAISSLAGAMGARMRAGCLPGAIVDEHDPGCNVTVAGVDTPRCEVANAPPCWDLVQDQGCPPRLTPGGNAQSLRFTVQGAPLSSVHAVCPLYEPAP